MEDVKKLVHYKATHITTNECPSSRSQPLQLDHLSSVQTSFPLIYVNINQDRVALHKILFYFGLTAKLAFQMRKLVELECEFYEPKKIFFQMSKLQKK